MAQAARQYSRNDYDQPNLRVVNKKRKKKSNKGWVVAVTFIIILLGVVIYRYNHIVQLNHMVSDLKKDYYATVDQNTQLKVFIEQNLDLNNIKDRAIRDLKMQKPGLNQKVPVSVPVQDLSIATPDAAKNNQGDILSFLSNTIKAVFG